MKKDNMLLWGLVVLFALLMSVPFIVPHTGFLALFGIVPLLCMERIAGMLGKRRIWIYHYSAFVLWNAITTFWVCNATVGGGIFAVLANSLQMSLIFGLFRLSKKKFNGSLPYIFLAAAWIAWERFYFDAEISWPWLVLGNSFARTTWAIQWYEFTGSLGGSLCIPFRRKDCRMEHEGPYSRFRRICPHPGPAFHHFMQHRQGVQGCHDFGRDARCPYHPAEH